MNCSVYSRLLYNDGDIGGYTSAVSGQRLDKQVPVARQQILTYAKVRKLNYKSGRTVFSTWFVLRCYKEGTNSVDSQFCTGLCEERT
jgi:hypothetical protein